MPEPVYHLHNGEVVAWAFTPAELEERERALNRKGAPVLVAREDARGRKRASAPPFKIDMR